MSREILVEGQTILIERTSNGLITGTMAKEFAEKLRSLIDARDLKDATVAKAIGADGSVINKWSKLKADHREGESIRRPTPMQFLLLARYFNVSVEYLIDDEMDNDTTDLTWQERAVVEIYRARVKAEGPDVMTPAEVAWRIEVPREALLGRHQPAE